ncbi:hypothetical protein HNQ56_003569 [Anaerotaenia torta]|uniref:hypothetical protein n=1 Tax=Anaerotaenia torta TaxID=433293 RepID=UPI003D216EAE
MNRIKTQLDKILAEIWDNSACRGYVETNMERYSEVKILLLGQIDLGYWQLF